MYDWPEVRPAYQQLWQILRKSLLENGVDAPQLLSHETDEQHWTDPDLLLGQTCGYPLATRLRGKVRYVATPQYAVKGCQGNCYSSALVVRRDYQFDADNLGGVRFAYTARNSLSGYRAPKAHFGDLAKVFGEIVRSGGHRFSARLLADGKAELATLDAVSWHLLKQHEPVTADQLKVVGWTQLRPALPLITSLKTSDKVLEVLRQRVCEVFSSAAVKHIRPELAISGCRVLPICKYQALAAL